MGRIRGICINKGCKNIQAYKRLKFSETQQKVLPFYRTKCSPCLKREMKKRKLLNNK